MHITTASQLVKKSDTKLCLRLGQISHMLYMLTCCTGTGKLLECAHERPRSLLHNACAVAVPGVLVLYRFPLACAGKLLTRCCRRRVGDCASMREVSDPPDLAGGTWMLVGYQVWGVGSSGC